MDDQFSVSVTARAAYVLVTLVGECDGTALREVLARALPRGAKRLFIDLSGLELTDSAGMAALLYAQGVVMARGGTMALACPQRIVARLLDLTGTNQRIPVYGSLTEAIRQHGMVPSNSLR